MTDQYHLSHHIQAQIRLQAKEQLLHQNCHGRTSWSSLRQNLEPQVIRRVDGKIWISVENYTYYQIDLCVKNRMDNQP